MTLHQTHVQDAAVVVLRRLTAAQALNAEVIHDLMSAPVGDTDAAITSALARMGGFYGLDRAFVLAEVESGQIASTHDWKAPDSASCMASLQGLSRAEADLWWVAGSSDLPLHVSDLHDLDAGDPRRAIAERLAARSLLVVPLSRDGRFSGFVGYATCDAAREFLPGEISLIASVSGIIAALLSRRAIEAEVARVRAAQDLERKRMQATLSVLPDLLLELDHGLRVTGVHANSRMTLPITPNSMLNQSIERLLPSQSQPLIAAIREELTRGDLAVGHRLELQLQGGSRWFALAAARRPSEVEGDPPGYVVIARDITETHLGRIEVERLGQIARNTTNLIVVTNLEGRIDWVNPAFETRTGYRLDEARGRTPGALLQTPQTDPRTVAAIADALRDRRPITCEVLNRTKSGEHYWVELSIQPMRDLAGQICGFMAVQTDMTQHHLTAQSLERALLAERTAREQLRAAVGIMQDAFLQFDAEQRLVLCNSRYRDLFAELDPLLVPGSPLIEILRAGVATGCYGLDTMPVEDWIAAELRAFDLRFTQSSVVRRHGRWFRLTKQPTPDGGRMILLSDITDLKNAEERALSDRERAMDASRDGIAMLSMQGQVLYANAAAAQIFGRASARDVVGAHWRDLLQAPDVEVLETKVEAALRADGFWQGPLQARRNAGPPLEIEISATRSGDGSTLCILRDISERLRIRAEQERLRDELELAHRREEVGQIAAGLTHDFNNLLAAISGAASLIEEIAGEDSKVLAESIGNAVDQASRLVRRMMSLGKKSGPKRIIDLRMPLRDAAELVQASLRAPVTLDLTLPDAPVFGLVDQTAMMQMVLNLMINARDALTQSARSGPARIQVALSLASEEDLRLPLDLGQITPAASHVRISVADTGPGMDAATREQIFSAYFSTKGERGTGLGLPIVASAVRDHQGGLALLTAPGEGACFTILLPLQPFDPTAESTPM